MSRSTLRRMLGTAIVLVATSVTGFAAASTGAIIEPAGSITATSSSVTFEGSGIGVTCPVTLRGSFAEGPVLVENGETLGRVSEWASGSCSGGSIERVLALPWTIAVSAALGSPPEAATGLRLAVQGFALNFSVFGGFVNCLYRGNLGALVRLTSGDPYTTGSMSLPSEVQLPLFSGSGLCPREIHGAGTFTLTQQEVGMGLPPHWTSPRERDFREVRVNATGRRTITLVNQETNAVTIPMNEIQIAGDQVFGGESNFIVNGERQVRANITFTPVAVREYSGTIEFKESGTVIWRARARGRGI